VLKEIRTYSFSDSQDFFCLELGICYDEYRDEYKGSPINSNYADRYTLIKDKERNIFILTC